MLYLIDERSLAAIKAVMLRLYTQDRMDGDAMRDAAQQLNAALDSAVPDNDGPPYDAATATGMYDPEGS